MAARKQLFHPDEIRKKIQASQLINRLQDYALSPTDGEIAEAVAQGEKPRKQIDMKPAQVKAAVALLKKVIPDLSQVSGDIGMVLTKHEEALKELE